jgi:hypothetical protein
MSPKITVLEHAFHFSLPVIPNKTTNLFSELTFDGEGNTSVVDHISKFLYKCLRHKNIDPNVTCKLFSLTFRDWVKCWFESFQSLQTMSPLVEEGTLNLKDDSCHTLIDFIIVSKVKEDECEVDNHVDDKYSSNLVE